MGNKQDREAVHGTPFQQEQVKEKMELVKRLMKGKDVDKNETKAVEILEECVALGCTDAMLLLAQWYAYGCGVEKNPERAETLISEAATKGLSEARDLMRSNMHKRHSSRIHSFL